MLKRPITYEDFDGETITEEFYFNLSKPELIELDVEYEGGLSGMLENVVKSKNNKEIIAFFKKIILMSFGVKSADGKRFIKSEEAKTEFSQTAAYNELYVELATDENAGAIFIQGILPRDLAGKIDQDKPVTLPPTPPTN